MHSTRATAYALSLLSSASSARVQGAFAHGFDLLLNTGSIVYVGEKNKALSANGIALDRSSFTSVYQIIQNDFHTDSQACELFSYIVELARTGDKICACAHTLKNSQALSTLAQELFQMHLPPAGIELPDFVSHTLLAGDATSAQLRQESLEWLYGRGPGLTPSGDDVLSGYVVGLIWADQLAFVDELKRVLDEVRSYRQTTYASDALLTASFARALSEPFYEMQEALEKRTSVAPALEHVLQIGHHSGADMLCGLMYACKMLEERCQSAL